MNGLTRFASQDEPNRMVRMRSCAIGPGLYPSPALRRSICTAAHTVSASLSWERLLAHPNQLLWTTHWLSDSVSDSWVVNESVMSWYCGSAPPAGESTAQWFVLDSVIQWVIRTREWALIRLPLESRQLSESVDSLVHSVVSLTHWVYYWTDSAATRSSSVGSETAREPKNEWFGEGVRYTLNTKTSCRELELTANPVALAALPSPGLHEPWRRPSEPASMSD